MHTCQKVIVVDQDFKELSKAFMLRMLYDKNKMSVHKFFVATFDITLTPAAVMSK